MRYSFTHQDGTKEDMYDHNLASICDHTQLHKSEELAKGQI